MLRTKPIHHVKVLKLDFLSHRTGDPSRTKVLKQRFSSFSDVSEEKGSRTPSSIRCKMFYWFVKIFMWPLEVRISTPWQYVLCTLAGSKCVCLVVCACDAQAFDHEFPLGHFVGLLIELHTYSSSHACNA